MLNKINAFFNPEQFQGWGKNKNYFEGWYFKIVDLDESRAYGLIPGLAMDENGDSHSFIQVLDGRKMTSEYHQFDRQDFIPTAGKFELRIKDNFFSEREIHLNLPDITGKLKFTGNIPWPKPWYSPGIMGPYSFVPFMECYHGVLSMNHRISGILDINGEKVNFDEGKGYIEKDWGRSFPSAYIWLQSNHFDESEISIKGSVAKIPWIGNSFTGFIAGVWLGDRLLRFTTYNNTILRKCSVTLDSVELAFENKNFLLELLVKRDSTTALASPILGAMEGRIEESMQSEIEVNLFDKKANKSIFIGSGRNTALEVAGEISEILT